MRSFEATTIIAATPTRVWAILTDVGAWPTWASGIRQVKGRLEVGAKLVLTAEGKEDKGYPFTVTTIEPTERLVLTGTARWGLFTGVRTYLVTPKGRGARIRVREEYHGRVAKLVVESIPDLSAVFQTFCDGLKAQAESGAGGATGPA
jgi:uncharacterized protein YndB with AHSA1/START domain